MVIGYYMTPVNPSAVSLPTSEVNDGPAHDKLSLTSLWDYVTRTQCLPENLDLDAFFCTIHERLKSPEWEIRQNALRVLVDFMPLLSVESLDERVGAIMPDLINNLGHLGPAVRKGAVDALKAYLNLSLKPNAITRDLVEWGVERYQENKIPTNVVLGIIMCLPFVINGKLNDATINYIIHRLLDKIVKVIHQETVLRALVRIRDLIGGPKFDAALSTHDTYNCKRNFELLCGVYDLHLFNSTAQARISNFSMSKSETLTDSDENSVSVPVNDNDRVILETEIQLDSGPSITMKIHEETSPSANSSNPSSPASNRTSGRTFKVLPDLSLDDGYIESVKRTPRRVRFGGEIVKLRTPDSDSNLDENDATISIISEGDQPVIEIKYIENETKTTTRTTRSLIPIPVKHTQSAPASPTGNNSTRSFARSKEYKSSPNLSKKISPTWGKSRIPRRRNIEIKKTTETKIQININETTSKDLLKPPKKKLTRRETFSSGDFKSLHQEAANTSPKSPKTSNKQKEKKTQKKQTKPAIVIPPIHQIKREDQFSPIPRHNQIELFHNLTRSPSPRPDDNGPPFPSPSPLSSKQNLLSHDDTPVGPKKPEPVTLPAIAPGQETKTNQNDNNSDELAFHIYTSSEGPPEDVHDSPIPVNNTGDCLTCSSSGSETGIRVERFHSAHLDDTIIEDLQNMDDIKARQRGLEELLRVIRTPTVLDSLQERLPSLFYILFSAVQHPTLQPIADEALTVIFGNMKQEALITRLQQICLSLAKLGSPSGIRLAIVLMRRVPPKLVVDQLLSESIIGAKSSKVREGALQIVMTVSRIYPSTDFNVHKSLRTVIRTLSDKKKKVRQAALETLAALAQITGNSMVLEIAQEVTSTMESPERQQILQVIRTRLSRKQLPTVNTNGTVQYSAPQGDSEIEWLSRGNSSSSSPSSPCIVSASPRNRTENTEEQDDDRNNNRLVRRQSDRFIAQRFIPSSARIPSNCNREIEQNEFESTNTSRRFVENYSPRSAMSAGVQSPEKKVNYWRNNARNQSFNNEQSEDLGSDWSSNREESHEGQNGNRTQVWAIDPTAFTNVGGGKLSPANGTLRQVYVVKNGNESKTAATNTDDFRHESPAGRSGRFRNPRGRSFSPPTTNRTGSYDSLPNSQHGQMQSQRSNPPHHQNTSHGHNHNHNNPGRFFRGEHYNDRHYSPKGEHEPIRKSFSSEQITGLDRFRKEHTFSSGSSSSSSVRQSGGNWRDLRSGIPVPIYDSKLRIRTKNANNAGKTKGPMTIPYYPPVKSPSPSSTPEKHDNYSANRQPFSSGSESSGYFTPPPETHHEPNASPDLVTPTLTPQISPQPERFVRIETPRKIDSEPESFDDDGEEPANATLVDEPDDVGAKSEFRASSSLTSLNLVERTLSKNETTNSLEFSKVSFDDLDASRRQIDVEIATRIQRKSVSSAPALNDSSFASPRPATVKTTLPGSCGESLDDTEAPEELYKSVSPEKKSPAKIVKSSVARRKSSRYGAGKCHEASGDRPFAKPREAFHDICAQLESTEWEVTMKGLQGLVRLIRHHKDVVENQMHAVCVMLGKHVRNLRSQVARNACYAATELAKVSRRPLEMELDELATPLLHRTADTNKFLRSDANAALDEMSAQLSVPKLVSVITFRGSLHQNAVVRSASARLLCNIVQRLGAEKVFQLPRDTRDKILLAGANGLMEGSLETRQHAKMLLGLLAEHCQFQKAMAEAVPASILRHIDKTMRLLIK